MVRGLRRIILPLEDLAEAPVDWPAQSDDDGDDDDDYGDDDDDDDVNFPPYLYIMISIMIGVW